MDREITALRSELGGKKKVRQFLLKLDSVRVEMLKRLEELE